MPPVIAGGIAYPAAREHPASLLRRSLSGSAPRLARSIGVRRVSLTL